MAVCILSVLYVWTLYNIPIIAIGVRHLRRLGQKGRKASPLRAEGLPTVSIVVPVKDEERVVGRLLGTLLRLDYPQEKREILIVEDGSMDKTVEICEEYARRHPGQIRLIRQAVSNGKPSALNHVLKYVRSEIIGVFDADNVPENDVLLKAVKYFEDSSVAAVQGRTCSINAHENMLTKFVSYEEAVQYEIYIRGKDVLKLFVPLTGSCYFIRRNVLEDVGGWDERALSEDMELAAKLTKRNYNVKYASDVRSWQENPKSLAQLFRQRIRWFRGSMEVALKYGSLLRNPSRKSFDAEMTLTGPFMFLPCVLGYFLGLFSLVFPFSPDPVLTFMSQGLAFANTIILLLIGVALIYLTEPRKTTNLLWLPFVYVYWMVQNFVAVYAFAQIILKRPRKWMKTSKTGVVTAESHVLQTSV